MASLETKQKVDDASGKPPIIFKSPGLKPDACFKVFDQEFHVTSMTLKLNSLFFRMFFEPSGGIAPSSSNPLFKSEWYTCIDNERLGDSDTWVLSSDPKFSSTTLLAFTGDKDYEITVFQKFLCCIFGRPYTFENAKQLRTLAEMAQYYLAIPAVSSSLYTAAHRSTAFTSIIRGDPCGLLNVAYTLRNKLLFHDSLTIALGSKMGFIPLQHFPVALDHYFGKAREVILSKIRDAHQILLTAIVTEINNYPQQKRRLSNEIADAANKSSARKMINRVNTFDTSLPAYFRACSVLGENLGYPDIDLKKNLSFILENNLKLDKNAEAGKGDLKNYFLCLRDSDITWPWEDSDEEWFI